MQLVQRKATTSKSKLILTDFKERKNVVEMEEIPGELILNLDQTGSWFHPQLVDNGKKR